MNNLFHFLLKCLMWKCNIWIYLHAGSFQKWKVGKHICTQHIKSWTFQGFAARFSYIVHNACCKSCTRVMKPLHSSLKHQIAQVTFIYKLHPKNFIKDVSTFARNANKVILKNGSSRGSKTTGSPGMVRSESLASEWRSDLFRKILQFCVFMWVESPCILRPGRYDLWPPLASHWPAGRTRPATGSPLSTTVRTLS